VTAVILIINDYYLLIFKISQLISCFAIETDPFLYNYFFLLDLFINQLFCIVYYINFVGLMNTNV
jgi:hypothetical protein